MIGKTLSHYKVLEKIGQGGMGEVYRAEDTNLSREVAIKVLPEQFTQDPQRLARFEREAKLLAQLNHPNIAAIHSFEHSDDIHFLVLELVEGETLAERVAKGPLPVEEALEVCRQIAEGVEAAHEKGVIHRDLKPANVKVTPEGKVKILDFGLAKAFEGEISPADISQSPTLTEEMTRAGVILGTAAYMSPEQARGEEVDKRTDIFAFGCVLYELLTGKRAFGGKTVTDTLAKVLEGVPDWKALPATTPWRIQDLLRRCLQKDVHDRLDGIANVRIEMKLALEEPATVSPIGVPSVAQPPLWRRAIPWSIAGLIAVIATVAIWLLTRPTPEPLTRFVITPPPTAPLMSTGGNDLAISPGGRRIVYLSVSGRSQLHVRSLDDFSATPIAGTETARDDPFFSPDGQPVAFFTTGELKKVSLMGGTSITICEAPSSGRSGSWAEDTIIFSSRGALYRVSAAGGTPESLVAPDTEKGELFYGLPEILPGGQALLFTIWTSPGTQIALLSLETGEQKVLLAGRQAHYAPTGHLVYALSETGTLMAAPFDLATLEVTGDSVPILEEVRQISSDAVDYGFSSNGTLIYVPAGESEGSFSLVWVDREGAVEPLGAPLHQYRAPRLSPDGVRVAVNISEASTDIWVYD
ncbi:protein kinase, partial [Acidobacteria bacterium AH-259-D05]|nr:protein kinase [Acidobacteria bacterium AH-259-D05]